MRILLAPASYAPSVGGVETTVAQLATNLQASGHHVRVITLRCTWRSPPEEVIDGISVCRLPMFFPHALVHRNPATCIRTTIKAVALPILLPWGVLSLTKTLRQWRPDVVNLHYVGGQAPYWLLARRLRNFPLVVSVHGTDIERDPLTSKMARRVTTATLHAAKLVLSNSQYLAKQARKIVPEIEAKIRIVGNGIDPHEVAETAQFSHTHPYVLGLGRFVWKKGFDILLKSFARVAHDHPEWDLLLAGDGVELRPCQELAKSLGLADRVRFLGSVARKEALALICGCDLFVLPSRSEPFGIVLLEAMAAKKPVVATDVGGVSDLILSGDTGLLVPGDSPEALASGIDRLIRDPGLRKDMGTRGYALMTAKFTIDTVVARHIEAYRIAMVRSNQRGRRNWA